MFALAAACGGGATTGGPGPQNPGGGGGNRFPTFFPPAPGERMTMGELAGAWYALDLDGWGFSLEVWANGAFKQTVHQPEKQCQQEGTVSLAGGQLVWYYAVNTCNTDYQGKSEPDPLPWFTPASFAVKDESEAVRVYHRVQ